MAQKKRKAQEQLTFPELEWLPVIQTGKPGELALVAEGEPTSGTEEGSQRKRKKPETTVFQLPESKVSHPVRRVAEKSEIADAVEQIPAVTTDRVEAGPLHATTTTTTTVAAERPQPAMRATLAAFAYAAVVAASVVVAVAAALGAYQFSESQQAERQVISLQKASAEAENQARAVALFVKYNELMMQPTPASAKGTKKEARYWKEGLAVGLLESLFNLTTDLKEWEPTLVWALERHGRYIREQRLSCKTSSPDFIKLAEKALAADSASLCREFAGAK